MSSLRLFRLIAAALLLSLLATTVGAVELPERRKEQFGRDFGYYLYPIVGEIPGMGKANGLGASVLNIADSDTDMTGYYVRGDFRASGLTLLDLHLLPQRLVFDIGYNDYMVAPIAYSRGLHSSATDVIHPKVEGGYLIGQTTLTFDDRRYELFARMLSGRDRLLAVLDSNGKAYSGIDTSWHRGRSISLGGIADLTDDRVDPRVGARFEFTSRLPASSRPDMSEYYVHDFNLTGYIPMGGWDTLALNLFHSRAQITRQGVTDYATLQQRYGLNCGQYPIGAARDACLATEAKSLAGYQANNRYGTASPLGGTQRLRSYDNGRYYAGQALFYGIEYRWNLTDERTPFNIYIAKGIRTGIQLAAFAERGNVAETSRDLFKGGRNSVGIGARLILSGVVIRFDVAQGSEGVQTQLFITYPWSMFSVDSPG